MKLPIEQLIQYLQQTYKIRLVDDDIKELLEFFLTCNSNLCYLYNKDDKSIIKVTRKEIVCHLY